MNHNNDPYNRGDRDNESIYSTTSISSSIFSTSSRLSKIPSAVKSSFSSVKHLIRNNKKNRSSSNNTSQPLSPFDYEVTASNSNSENKPKRQNPAAFLFTRRQTDNNNSVVSIAQEQEQQQISPNEFNIKKQPKRRNSVVNLANRFIRRDHNNNSTDYNEQSYNGRQSPSSPLTLPPLVLEGIKIDHVSDTKSERMPTKEEWQDQPWMRQRAKSCQENKTPLLRHLAQKSIPDLPESDSIPYKLINNNESPRMMDGLGSLPLFKGLVTATLTTLHTRLINECDRTLALVLLPSQQQEKPTGSIFPQEPLALIIADVQKMTEMVKWDDESKNTMNTVVVGISRTMIKKEVDDIETSIEIAKLNYYNTNDIDALVISLKEIVSKIKCIMNLCICQYYKVAEKAIAIPSKGYRIEGKNKYGQLCEDLDRKDNLVQHSNESNSCHNMNYSLANIDHMDEQACWYRDHFLSQEKTCTFFGYNDEGEPLLISAVVEVENQKKQYRLIHRTKKLPDTRKLVMDSFLMNAPDTSDELEEIVPETTWKTVIETNLETPFNKLKQMPNDLLKSSGLEDEILKLDENSLHLKYKFGVLLIKEGQTKEEEWFANEHDSGAFDRFLNIIGTPIELKGYTGWAAGLDTKSGDSGDYTFTSTWNGNILAYHVAPLIPSKQGDKQQIQRKRHIGNDIVCIVFVQGNQPFNPSAIKSQFLHVFIIVHQETYKDKTAWSVEVVTIEGVPPFGPPLPENGIFYEEKELSEFILSKLVNAEYAAFKSPKFSMPNARAREGIFSDIVERGLKIIDDQANNASTSRKHCKTPSTSSSHSSRSLKLTYSQKSSESISPSPSKSSNAIKEFSENLASLGRRRSIQDLNEKAKTKTKQRKQKSGISKRSRSELDLIHIADSGKQKDGIKHRAQNILTSIPRFGRRSSLPHPEISVSTPAFPEVGNSR